MLFEAPLEFVATGISQQFADGGDRHCRAFQEILRTAELHTEAKSPKAGPHILLEDRAELAQAAKDQARSLSLGQLPFAGA